MVPVYMGNIEVQFICSLLYMYIFSSKIGSLHGRAEENLSDTDWREADGKEENWFLLVLK